MCKVWSPCRETLSQRTRFAQTFIYSPHKNLWGLSIEYKETNLLSKGANILEYLLNEKVSYSAARLFTTGFPSKTTVSLLAGKKNRKKKRKGGKERPFYKKTIDET